MFLILLIGALPALLLILYVYHLDKIEKEPLGLLVRLFIFGCLTTIAAIVLESIFSAILNRAFPYEATLIYQAIMNFLVVAWVEEGVKHFALRRATWKHPAFDFQFDAVVYSVVVALGFAAAENVGYILGFGLGVAPIRAVTAIPMHAIAGVFMGHYYGMAKTADIDGNHSRRKTFMFLSMFVPVILHGFYDLCASSQSAVASLLWLAFVVILDIVAFVCIRKYSRTDQPV